MPQNFTPNNLLALLYNETTQTEKQEIISEMIADPALAEEFSGLSEIVSLLGHAELDPHPTSLAIILEHSARTHEVHHV